MTFQDFNAIAVDDFSKSAPDGVTEAQLKTKFGAPADTSTVTQDGKQATVMTWHTIDGQKDATLSVSFIDTHAFSKSINNYRPKDAKTLTLAAFNQLSIGESADQVLDVMGLPNQVNNVFINESLQITYTYQTADHKVVLTFIDNKLQGKSQNGLAE